MTQIQLPKNIIKMFDNVQINGVDYKTEETAISPSAQQILAENRESAQNILQPSIEQEIGQEVKAVELNETLHNVKDESARNNILKEVSTRAREITRVEGLIESEASTRASTDVKLQKDIESEASTRASEITRVEGLIESEASTRASTDAKLQKDIESEASTRASTDAKLQKDIESEASTRASEITRVEGLIESEASTREREITRVEGLIESEASTRASTDAKLQKDIESEASTRASTDATLNNNINTEVSTREREITRVEGLIESEASTRASTDATLNNNINTINSKIPSQASSTNQLADKDFVNSSIATNTANFIGTFTDIEELKRQPATNNDYAFWLTTDSAGNILFKRYKYIASTNSWVFEYDLNNSSFTSEQWLAIQSGITAVLVAKLKGIEEGAQVNTITGVKGGNESSYRTGNVNITKDNVGLGNVVNTGDSATPVSGGTTKFTTGGAYTELNKKNDKITVSEDYSTTLTDDHAFTLIPKGANPTVGKNRTLSQVWDYIKSKANSVYAKLSHTHTKSQITDFPTSLPANGGTANKAVEVVDYGNTSATIKVGYNSPSVPKDKLLALAGFTERTASSIKLKDVTKANVKKWLDMESAPYINTLDIAISSEVSVTMNTFTSNAINAPVAIDGLVITHHLSSTRATQLALCGAQLFTRTYSNSTWSAWNAMWNTQES